MENKALDYEITQRYSKELEKIRNKLEQLKKGRVYERSQVKSDGGLCKNVEELEKMLGELLDKIQNGKPSIEQNFEIYSDNLKGIK